MSEATSSQQKGRPSNAINVTTSETIRVDGDRNSLHLQPMPIGSVSGQVGVGTTYHKKKTTSFQITSVTSRDGGEDSADDTEDISEIMDSSKVTDYDQETPTSFSEDTYSKSEDVFFGPAPVIPTSSQYGITALVQQPGTGGVMTARLPQGVTVNVTEGGIALAKADGEPDDVEQWQNRFKIVKIDSTEPFKRGRWTCLDFMDSPAGTANACPSKDDVPSLIVNSISTREPEAPEQQPQTVLQVCIPSANQQQQSSVQQPTHSVPAGQYQSQTAQPISGQPPSVTTMVPTPQVAPSLVSIQSGQHGVTQQGAPPGMAYPPTNVVPTQAPPTMVGQGYATSSQTPQGSVHPSPSAQTPPQTQPPMQQPQPHQQPQAPPQGISAQAPGVSQTNLVQAVHSHPSDIQQVSAPVSSVPPGSMQSGVVPSTSLPQAATHQQQPGMGTQSLPQQGMAAQNVSIPQQSGGMAQPAAVKAQNLPQQNLPQSVPQQVMSGVPQQTVGMAQTGHPGMVSQGGGQAHPQQSIQPTNLTGQVGPPQTMPAKSTVTTQNIVPPQQIAGTGAMPVQPGGGGAMPSVSSQPNVGAPPVSYSSLPSAGGTTTPATTPAQPQAHLNVGSAPQVQTTGTQAQPSAPPTHSVVGGGKDQLVHEGGTPGAEDPGATPGAPMVPEDSESASNASTVAIDNKIEQAMDLVKSHLMFAVREEVEVLKEKIGELMDRISQLEYENTVLRQCATQDALQQIAQPHPNSNT